MRDTTCLSDNIASNDKITYEYDAAFRMTTITQQIAGTAGPQMVMSYDSGGRMTEQQRTIGGGGLSLERTGGASLRRKGGEQGRGKGAGVWGRDLGPLVPPPRPWRDQQTTGCAMSFAHERNSGMQGWIACDPPEHTGYDAEGNMTGETDSGGNVWTFAYDYRDRMTGFTEKNSGGTVIAQGTYVYDALDRRIETIESVSGGAATVTWMVYNGFSDTPFAEYSSGGTLEYRYLSGPSYIAGVDSLLARTSSGGTTGFYLTDQLGSVTDIVNSSGTVLDHVAYDPFGNVLSETSPSNGDQFKFEGMAVSSLSGIQFRWLRELDSRIGRFVSTDPSNFAGRDPNLFRFCSDDPSNLVDPTGLDATDPDADPNKTVVPPTQSPTFDPNDPFGWYPGDSRSHGKVPNKVDPDWSCRELQAMIWMVYASLWKRFTNGLNDAGHKERYRLERDYLRKLIERYNAHCKRDDGWRDPLTTPNPLFAPQSGKARASGSKSVPQFAPPYQYPPENPEKKGWKLTPQFSGPFITTPPTTPQLPMTRPPLVIPGIPPIYIAPGPDILDTSRRPELIEEPVPELEPELEPELAPVGVD